MRDCFLGAEWVVLIHKTQRDLVSERPCKKIVVLTPHEYNKQRNMRPLPNSVTVEVATQAEAISMDAGIERWAVE